MGEARTGQTTVGNPAQTAVNRHFYLFSVSQSVVKSWRISRAPDTIGHKNKPLNSLTTQSFFYKKRMHVHPIRHDLNVQTVLNLDVVGYPCRVCARINLFGYIERVA
jgi:hypothetical protein